MLEMMARQTETAAVEIHVSRFNQGSGMGAALTAATMLMLSAAQEPVGWSFLSWVALVPWVVAVCRARSARQTGITSYCFGLAYFLANMYWLAGVTWAGYIALCFYLAFYFVVCGFILRGVYRFHPWPLTIVLPVLWVGQEYLRATAMTGFPWLFLSHGLHRSQWLIQISDLTGAYGVTFLAAMVNGLWCDLLLRPIKRPGALIPTWGWALATAGLIAASLFYGRFRMAEGRNTITEGPKLAMIQEVIPQFVKESSGTSEEIFNRHMALSRQALAAPVKPDLIAWPETMATSPLNREFLEMTGDSKYDLSQFEAFQTSRSFDERLRQIARQGPAVLVGTPSLEMKDFGNELRPDRQGNSAVLYLPGGGRFPRRYDKMHLVPFGEVVPFKRSWPWLHNLLNQLTPYDYDYTLDAGDEAVAFEFRTAAGIPCRFGVLICYEDVMPQGARRHTVEAGQKRVDYLLNISNDGWFVRGGKNGQPITATTELFQHLVICKFRAVENRIGIARAVNTGISAFIRPDGVIQQKPLAGTLPDDPAARQVVPGFLTDTVWLDKRVSFYSRTGDVFAGMCAIGLALLFLDAAVLEWWSKRRRKHPSANTITPKAQRQ
jgi:apolipoprotein N-acyltransferase